MNFGAYHKATEVVPDPTKDAKEQQAAHEAAQLSLLETSTHEQWLSLPMTQQLIKELQNAIRNRQNAATEICSDALTVGKLLSEARTLNKTLTYVITHETKYLDV